MGWLGTTIHGFSRTAKVIAIALSARPATAAQGVGRFSDRVWGVFRDR